MQQMETEQLSELKQDRLAAGYGLREAAELLGIFPITHMPEYETGRRQIPADVMEKMRELYQGKQV